ncbi:MAG: hypothetical protein QNK37_00275 [Acidobacteriota bacterium]|nr:hypothetical protein [Acidobacteriota bacterium]
MDDILERIRSGNIPDHALGALARGMVPIEGEIMIEALFLVCEKDPGLLEDARTTFDGLPDGLKKTFFQNREIEADINAFYLKGFSLPVEVKSAIILNPMTPAVAIAEAAPGLESVLLDLAVNNQVKILEEPAIIDRLRLNPALSINQKQKLDEYGRLLLKAKIAPAEELEGLSTKEIEEQAIADAREFVAAFGKESGPMKKTSMMDTARAKPAAKEEPKVEAPPSESPKPGAPVKKEKLSILEQLASMSVPQKVQAAIKGDREVRSTLIRDSNKLVCCAVIKSPRITESEVEFYSNLRNVQTDVLRLIASNREWTKSYKIIYNLIKNPRTPIAFTMKFLPRLNKKDLKGLERDRNVPEALRKMAKRIGRGGK